MVQFDTVPPWQPVAQRDAKVINGVTMTLQLPQTAAIQCLGLLAQADAILLEAGEGVLAAHLSAVIEPLREYVGGTQGAVGTGLDDVYP